MSHRTVGPPTVRLIQQWTDDGRPGGYSGTFVDPGSGGARESRWFSDPVEALAWGRARAPVVLVECLTPTGGAVTFTAGTTVPSWSTGLPHLDETAFAQRAWASPPGGRAWRAAVVDAALGRASHLVDTSGSRYSDSPVLVDVLLSEFDADGLRVGDDELLASSADRTVELRPVFAAELPQHVVAYLMLELQASGADGTELVATARLLSQHAVFVADEPREPHCGVPC